MTESQAAHPQQAASPFRHTNRLIKATSPYLLQHAHNPVDWHEWGEEAFDAACKADKPIFLSVGYSTCYWCHVMERESFENEAVAAIMNEHFICIKVDREERPDVDDIYMSAVQTFTQLTEGRASGGWPMSVFLEPKSLKPFYAGTYYPPEPRFGRPSFPQLLQFIAQTWDEKRNDILAQADQIAAIVAEQLSIQAAPRPLDQSVVETAINQLMGIYDPADAGFGRAPKFPQPVFLELLLACAWERDDARQAVLHTLDRMATGGMYDQIGGGFHRYSTDAKWLVPHFEKMLYDNGQLVSVYAEAYARSGDALYAQIVRETLEYVLREMTAENGGFYSAQDAEVDAREGLNYLWTPQQVRTALKNAGLDDLVDFALDSYGFGRGTNFQDPHHPEDPPANVVFLIDRPVALAKTLGIPIEEFNARIENVNAALLAVRSKRKAPGTDDKILAGWNGLMIAGFADAGRVLKEPRYIAAAERAAAFILANMRDTDGGLFRSSRNGTARVEAFLEDYALLIRGLLALHGATGKATHLDDAVALADDARARFADSTHGGYFDTLADQADLFVRTKSSYDGAVPSANGVMGLNLLDLHERTGRQRYIDEAAALLRGLSARIADGPLAAALSTIAAHRVLKIDPETLRVAAPHIAAGPTTIDPVTISLSTDSIALNENASAEIVLTMLIEKPFHINAHEPGPRKEPLIGLRVELQNAGGLAVEADYPPGDLYHDEIRIHRGRVTIPIQIRKIDPISGQPMLTVTYQVCNDELCLRPTTKTLPLRIAAD